MSRHDEDRLTDIIEASDAISRHLLRGDFSDELVIDAVRVRLIEIGESVKEIDPNVLKLEPAVAWRDAAAMRDWLAHHYFDTSAEGTAASVDEDLPPLVDAARRLANRLRDTTTDRE